jgi:hypothetical protein
MSGPPDAPPKQPKSAQPGSDDPPPLILGGAPSGPTAGPPGRWSAYAAAVQSSIDKALASSGPKISAASYDVEAELWVDPKGHVTQARLTRPSGNSGIDAALNSEIFPRLMLPEPAKDLPQPIRAHVRNNVPADATPPVQPPPR